MKTTKTNLILYVVCTVAIIIAIISMFKVKQSQQELNELQNKMRAINTPTSENKLIKIDSLLVLGHYESAIDAYKKQFDTYEATDTGNTDLKLRIELAKKHGYN